MNNDSPIEQKLENTPTSRRATRLVEAHLLRACGKPIPEGFFDPLPPTQEDQSETQEAK